MPGAVAVPPDMSPGLKVWSSRLGVWSSPRLESDDVTESPTPKPIYLPGRKKQWLSGVTVGLHLRSCAFLLLHQASASYGSPPTSRPSQLASHELPTVPLARHGARMENSDARSSVVQGKRALMANAEPPYFDLRSPMYVCSPS